MTSENVLDTMKRLGPSTVRGLAAALKTEPKLLDLRLRKLHADGLVKRRGGGRRAPVGKKAVTWAVAS